MFSFCHYTCSCNKDSKVHFLYFTVLYYIIVYILYDIICFDLVYKFVILLYFNIEPLFQHRAGAASSEQSCFINTDTYRSINTQDLSI